MIRKIPVIIDCDPGLDDVVALLLAGRNEAIDLKGVTVVGGNQTLEKVGNNALKVLSFAGIDVAVGYGFRGPMVGELLVAGEVHGEDGIQGVVLPQATLKPSKLHAIDLIASILKNSKEKVNIVAMGPLTNIAMFLMRYPELKEKIEKISLMGGAIRGGNCTRTAEFNIYVDPEAASIVFKSGVPIIMSGLDITQKANVLPEDIDKIKKIDNKAAKLLAEILDNLLIFHKSTGFNGCHLHDPVALLALTNPEMIKTRPLQVEIELQGKFTRGMTVANTDSRFNQNPNAQVGYDIDRKAFVENIIDTVKKY